MINLRTNNINITLKVYSHKKKGFKVFNGMES